MKELNGQLQELLGRKPRLLVVDDHPINIQALYQVFAGDCQVLMATDGAKGLALCREQLPDLVLLDVQMPGMDGHEVCRQIKADAQLSEIPVIFVTAHQDADSETLGLSVGAVDFIAKPFNPAVVRARVRTHLVLKLQTDLLRQQALLDGLTGLYNRRAFDERFDAEFRRARRNNTPLALVMVDVDHFKLYNDRYGHPAGDDCLRGVALALRCGVKRPGDLVCRYGGEEFACVLPETDAAGALHLADLLEQMVRSLGNPNEDAGQGKVVTISLGVAVGVPGETLEPQAMVQAADGQLYKAKELGRARVSMIEI